MINKFIQFAVVFSFVFSVGCAVETVNQKPSVGAKNPAQTSTDGDVNNPPPSAAKIKIEPNSPADTVRVFYRHLRENRFREAMFLTNLRPAIEGLTDAELQSLQIDFAPLAAQVPADIEINGEITSGDTATVTAKLPDNETDELKLQEIRLRREGGYWTILTVDEQAEAKIKREGKNYFAALKIETHEEEAKAMMHRISKAQMIYSMQNDGFYADAPTLIARGYLPADIQTAATTGYNFTIAVAADKTNYAAAATPAIYGKTGKLSFGYEEGAGKMPKLKSKDAGGKDINL